MVARTSAEFDTRTTTTSPLSTSNAISHVRGDKTGASSLSLASQASTHAIAVDVLLVVVSVVSTLLVVTIILLVVFLRLLKRVAAAHRPLSSTNSDEEQEEVGSDAFSDNDGHGTDDDDGRVVAESEQRPLLIRQQRQQQHQQQQHRRASSLPDLLESLRIVLGIATSLPRNSADGERRRRTSRTQRLQHGSRQRRGGAEAGGGEPSHASPQCRVDGHHEAHVAPSLTTARHHTCNPLGDRSTPGVGNESKRSVQPAADGGAVARQRVDVEAVAPVTPAATAANDGEAATPFHAASPKDLVVYQTTHDSRYRLLQRIGMGAFSSVYLVQHKTTGHKYALKYILCKDDRERLAALRECEVIHCLQGHPQVIRIVDMFMNYQFQCGEGGPGKVGVPTTGYAAATASLTRHPGNSLRATAPPPPPPSSQMRQSLPWQVTSTGTAALQATSQHTARSLTHSPSLWARPTPMAMTPTSPVFLLDTPQPHASSGATAPAWRPLASTTGNSMAHSTTATAAPAGPRGSAVATPASPTGTTKWVGVKLLGLHDTVMKKVGSASKLDDTEVVAAVRARMCARGHDGEWHDMDADDPNRTEDDTVRSGTDEEEEAVMQGDSDDSVNAGAETEGAPLLLSAADTERLLMDARLLQQRRHRQRAQNRQQRRSQKSNTPAATATTTATKPGAAAASSVADRIASRSASVSSALPPQQPRQPLQQHISVQHVSRSSSRGVLPSPSTSSSSLTRGSLPTAGQPQRYGTNTYGGGGGWIAEARVASGAHRPSPISQGVVGLLERFDAEVDSPTGAPAPPQAYHCVSSAGRGDSGRGGDDADDDGVGVHVDAIQEAAEDGSPSVTKDGATTKTFAVQSWTAIRTTTATTATQASATAHSLVSRRSLSADHAREDSRFEEDSTSEPSPASSPLENEAAASLRTVREKGNGNQSSSSSSSSGAEEEPIQPIRRILVPPPSYMRPPAGFDMGGATQSRATSHPSSPLGQQPTHSAPQSPTSYVSKNRYANFALNLGGVVPDAAEIDETAAPLPGAAPPPPLLDVSTIVECALIDADIDAPTPEAAAVVAKASMTLLSHSPRKARSMEHPQSQASSLSSLAPAATSSTSLPASTYAPMRAVAAAAAATTASAPLTSVPAGVTSAISPLLSPTAAAAAASAKGDPHLSSTLAMGSSSTAMNRSGISTYAPAREGGRPAHYVNPYLERAFAGEVVPPPRTSYAPGGGVRYNSLVAPLMAASEPTSATTITTTTTTAAAPRRGPVVRAWNDGSSAASAAAAAVAAQLQPAQEELQQPQPSTAAFSLPMRSTYAPLRYGNLVQPAAAAVVVVESSKPEESILAVTTKASTSPTTPPLSLNPALQQQQQQQQQQQKRDGALVAPARATSSVASSCTAAPSTKASSGRLSVSAAIRSARAGQQGERMHLNDGKPHVHVPTPKGDSCLIPPPPFTNPNELNRTHTVYGHANIRASPLTGSGAPAKKEEEGEAARDVGTRGRTIPPSSSLGDVTAYDDAPTPQKPLYTNLGVALTDATPGSPVTATSPLYRDAAPSYGATSFSTTNRNTFNNINALLRSNDNGAGGGGGSGGGSSSNVGAKTPTYAPAVRYANAGNPTLWCAYGQPGGAAIGPASVAAARATADLHKSEQRTANTSIVDEDGATALAGGGNPGRKHAEKEKEENHSAAETASTTQSNSSSSLTQDVRDTGYLCLVMDYHPMGDLCHYVLRAKQQLALQREQQQQQQSMRASISHSAFDGRATATPTTPSPSDHSSNAYSGGGGGFGAEPNSPTMMLGSSTTSWMVAAAAATWWVKPATSKADPNFAMASTTAAAAATGENEDEREDVTRHNPLTEPQLLSIAYQLSSVLDHMHHQSPPVIHRDLKPENILIKGELTDFLEDVPADVVRTSLSGIGMGHRVSKPGSPLSPAAPCTGMGGRGSHAERSSLTPHTPSLSSAHGGAVAAAATLTSPPPIRITRAVVPIVVTDFGLAMVQETHGRSHSGRGGGTRPYIAPECWQGATCTASDVWSLGCVLYALATGRLTARTVRLMSEEAKRDGFASRMLNDIILQKYSLAFASFVVSLLVVDPTKRPSAAQAAQCFLVTESDVRFDPASPFFSNVFDL